MLCFFSDQFDTHDERDDDGEGESVEEHKSVIMHLLSQVRLGMDLTKVNTNNRLYFFTFSPISFIQFPPFNPSLSSSGRLADIYLGAEVVAGNVCRFLCTPRFVCEVMHILSFFIDLTAVLPYGLIILMSDYSSAVIIVEFKSSNASTNMTTFLRSQTATELFPMYCTIGSNVATK